MLLLLVCQALGEESRPQATNLWSIPFGGYPPIICTPAVAPDGTIYAGGFDGRFHALSAEGKELWTFRTGRQIKSSPAVADDGTIYFGSRDHALYALTPAGKLKWRYVTGAWVDSSPAIAADGTVYFGSWDENFYALHPDGTLKWKFNVGRLVDSSPAIGADGTIYFGAHNKRFYALDPAGNVRWTFLTEAEITSSPAIDNDGSIYFGSTDGNLYHLKSDGTEIWRCRTGSGADGSPVLADDGNIAMMSSAKLLLISPAGRILWAWGSDAWLDETPLAAQGTVCFSSPWRRLWAVKPEDGGSLWEASLSENVSSSPVPGPEGQVYFASGNRLIALQPPATLLPARSPWPMFRGNPRHTGRVAPLEPQP